MMPITRTLMAALVTANLAPLPLAARDIDADYVAAQAARTLEAFAPTGLAVAVLQGDQVVFAQGYGVREVGRPEPVTAETLFPIASVTKAFTGAALAILVDEGKVEWDAPVIRYLPDFRMADPWVNREFTVRDLLTHRSGLPLGAGDLLFVPDGDPSVADILNALGHLQPTTSFRSRYDYDNLLYAVAGEVVARVSGLSWAEFVEARLMRPLGMTDCVAERSRAPQGVDLAVEHLRDPGAAQSRPVDPRLAFPAATAPGGGILCSAAHMMHWARFWLAEGLAPDGTRLISADQMAELWRGITPAATRSYLTTLGRTHLSVYALGWFKHDFHGHLLVEHGGGSYGAITLFALLPEKDAAVIVMVNDYMTAPVALGYQILNAIAVDGEPGDWIAELGASYADFLANAKQDAGATAAPPADAAAPSLPLAAYAGTYRDAWYGDVTIRPDGDGLFIDMSRSTFLDGPLSRYDGDTFVARWPDRALNADAFVTFSVEDGRVLGLDMRAVSPTTDFSFDFHDLDLKRVD